MENKMGNDRNVTASSDSNSEYLTITASDSGLSSASIRFPTGLTSTQKNDFQSYVFDSVSSYPGSFSEDTFLGSYLDTITDSWIMGQTSTDVSTEELDAAKTSTNILNISPATTYTGSGSGTYSSYDPNAYNNMYTGSAEDRVRQSALLERQSILNPSSDKSIGSKKFKNGTLIDTLSGADLSVFFLTELPLLKDVMDTATPKHLWKKELMLMEIDSVLSATYSIMREVFPVRSVGRSKPNGFTRGPMTISGSLAFTIFTEDVLVRLRTQMQTSINDMQAKTKKVIDAYTRTSSKASSSNKESMKSFSTIADNYNLYNKILNTGGIFMLNQLLPFHILIMGTTERGIFAKMMLKNIRVIDENQMQGVQQPNIVNRISFVAEDIFPLMTGNTADAMSYSSAAVNDQDKISGNPFSIYTGSQVMKDVAAMASGEYRLQEIQTASSNSTSTSSVASPTTVKATGQDSMSTASGGWPDWTDSTGTASSTNDANSNPLAGQEYKWSPDPYGTTNTYTGSDVNPPATTSPTTQIIPSTPESSQFA